MYNATIALQGKFLDVEVSEQLASVAVNCATPIILTNLLGKPMAARAAAASRWSARWVACRARSTSAPTTRARHSNGCWPRRCGRSCARSASTQSRSSSAPRRRPTTCCSRKPSTPSCAHGTTPTTRSTGPGRPAHGPEHAGRGRPGALRPDGRRPGVLHHPDDAWVAEQVFKLSREGGGGDLDRRAGDPDPHGDPHRADPSRSARSSARRDPEQPAGGGTEDRGLVGGDNDDATICGRRWLMRRPTGYE